MTRVDFYQLDPARHRYEQVVCHLCQKAWDNRQMTLLLTQDPQQSQHLDHRLWTFADDSFIPHDSVEDEGFATPILVHDDPEPAGDRQLLINLSGSVLTDLIEKGVEITMSDLGLDESPATEDLTIPVDDMEIELGDPALALRDPALNPAPVQREYLADNPALEREVRRILDEHMELAWQEIRLAIQRHLDRS
jgi:DNA polymerase IIIc chi subunit